MGTILLGETPHHPLFCNLNLDHAMKLTDDSMIEIKLTVKWIMDVLHHTLPQPTPGLTGALADPESPSHSLPNTFSWYQTLTFSKSMQSPTFSLGRSVFPAFRSNLLQFSLSASCNPENLPKDNTQEYFVFSYER